MNSEFTPLGKSISNQGPIYPDEPFTMNFGFTLSALLLPGGEPGDGEVGEDEGEEEADRDRVARHHRGEEEVQDEVAHDRQELNHAAPDVAEPQADGGHRIDDGEIDDRRLVPEEPRLERRHRV